MGWGGFEPPRGAYSPSRARSSHDSLRTPTSSEGHSGAKRYRVSTVSAWCVQRQTSLSLVRTRFRAKLRALGRVIATPVQPLWNHDAVVELEALMDTFTSGGQIMSEYTTPIDAVERYLESRAQEVSDSTLQNHRYRLKQFLLWCGENDITDIAEVTMEDIEDYKLHRINEDDLKLITIQQQLRTLRVFLEYCGSLGLVDEELASRMLIPSTDAEQEVSNETVQEETATAVIEYLERYEYASLRHVLFHLLWHTGMRMGSVRALDIDDWHTEGDDAYLTLRHRPDTGTPLKLKEKGERNVTIFNSDLIRAINDWLEMNHPRVSDQNGRLPFLGTEAGRPATSTIRRNIYLVTSPCYYTGRCPHDNDPDTCEYAGINNSHECPSSYSPHPIRRGSITAHLNREATLQVVSERANVSAKTLKKHYRAEIEEDKREVRKEQFRELMDM